APWPSPLPGACRERASEQAFLAFELGVEVVTHLADLAEDLRLGRAGHRALRAEQFVRELQRRHHCDAVDARDAARLANRAHLLVDHLHRLEQLRLGLAADRQPVVAVEDLDVDLFHGGVRRGRRYSALSAGSGSRASADSTRARASAMRCCNCWFALRLASSWSRRFAFSSAKRRTSSSMRSTRSPS